MKAEYEYYNWLVNQIQYRGVDVDDYSMLLQLLYSRSFYWSIEHDDARADDGLMLRAEFESKHDVDLGTMPRDCTVLEMMIALAHRCEDVLSNNKGVAFWFWSMIRNMALIDSTDDRFDIVMVQRAITSCLNRDYSPNGRGGLFWVGNKNDARKMEIWYQMHAYLKNFM